MPSRLKSSLPVLIPGALIIAQILWFLFHLATWMDEGNYLYKSSALIGHGMKLYSEELPCWYTPLYFVALGTWQEIADYSLTSGRCFSILCYIAIIALMAWFVKRTFDTKNSLVWLLAIIVVTPSITAFHSSVTQFAFVNLQIMLLLFVLFARKEDRYQFIFAGALLGTIAMTRPNMLLVVPLLIPLYFWIKGGKNWKTKTATLVTSWIVVDAIVIAIFGSGAFWNMIRVFPGAEWLVSILGLTTNPAIGTLEGTDLGLRVSAWWKMRPEHTTASYKYFLKDFIWPYLVILTVNIIGIVHWFRSGKKASLASGMAILFIWSALIHFLATQTYCKTCSHAYMNYSIVFGLIGGVGCLPVGREVFEKLKHTFRRADYATCAVVAIWAILAFLPSGPYRKWYGNDQSKLLQQAAARLNEKVPADAHILPMGVDIRLTEIVHHAGKTVDPLTINYLFSRREPLVHDQSFSSAENSKIRQRGLWTDSQMKQWLEKDHNYVIYHNKMAPNRDLLDQHFDSQPLFPDVPEDDKRSHFRIAIRKPISVARNK